MNSFISRIIVAVFVVTPVVFFIVISHSIPVAFADSSLVASYSFDEGAGTSFTDQSGNGNAGILSNGAAFTPDGKYGGAIDLDGVNELATVTDSSSLDLTSGMTLEAWVKPSVVTGWRTILLMSSGNDLAYSLYANSSSNKPDFQINNGATVYETFGVTKLVLNAWAHIAGTYDGTTLKIYVNGNLVSQKTVTASALITTGKLFIGGNTVWGEYFKGLIDDVRIYSKTLIQSEIQNDMNSPVN